MAATHALRLPLAAQCRLKREERLYNRSFVLGCTVKFVFLMFPSSVKSLLQVHINPADVARGIVSHAVVAGLACSHAPLLSLLCDGIAT